MVYSPEYITNSTAQQRKDKPPNEKMGRELE